MDILLVFFYTLIFCAVIFYSKNTLRAGLSKEFILTVFLLKCIFGILYTYIHIHKYGGGDTLNYFNDSNIIFNTIQDDPVKYLLLTFSPNGSTVPDAIMQEEAAMGYWWDTSAYMVVRFNALVHLFSLGNFYVHGIFMSFLSLLGLLLLYRSLLASNITPNLLMRIAVFFIPSVLFWTSGVHKEGLLIFGLGAFFFCTVLFMQNQRWYYLAGLFLASFYIYLIRDFFFFLLIPGLIAYIICRKTGRYYGIVFLIVYLTGTIGATFITAFDGRNYLQMISLKQEQFKSLESGNTNIQLTTFDPSISGVIKQLPQALKNSLFGPILIGDYSFLHILSFLETLLMGLAVIAALFLTKYRQFRMEPLLLWFFFFSFSLLVLIGYIVPNVGAIVRYRTLCWPFLFLFIFYNVDLKKIFNKRISL